MKKKLENVELKISNELGIIERLPKNEPSSLYLSVNYPNPIFPSYRRSQSMGALPGQQLEHQQYTLIFLKL